MAYGYLLESVNLKIERAEYHLGCLHKMGAEIAKRKPYSADLEPDPNIPQRLNYRAKVKEQPSGTYRAVLGDCIHNLRAALDNLAFALAIRESGDPPPYADKIVFPIRWTFSLFPSMNDTGQVLGAMPRAARKIIETLQPYHRRKDPLNHPLWRLRELDDIDKHRVPHVAIAVPTSASFKFSVPLKGTRHKIIEGPMKDDDIIAWVDLTDAIPQPPAPANVKVDVQAMFGYGIAFNRGEPGQGQGVTWLIEEELLPYVKDVILPKFTRFFA